MNKKHCFLLFLMVLSNFLWAQQCISSTILEGTWNGIGNNDNRTNFFFKNNQLIMTDSTNGEIIMGTFTHSDRVITINITFLFTGTEWITLPDGSISLDMEFVFSGNNLIIVRDGDSISLKKIE